MLIALLVSVVTLVGVGIGPGAVGLLIDRGFGDPQAIHLALLSVIALAALACAATAPQGCAASRNRREPRVRDKA